jgi:hypothetical protein
MKKFLLLTFVLFSITQLNAQTTWTYAGAGGSAGAEVSKSICTDASGNIYVTGNFTNTVDFDYSTGGTATLTAGGTFSDIFIASYTSTGAYRWAVKCGSPTRPDNSVQGAICTDGTNVYVTGNFGDELGNGATFGSTVLHVNGGAITSTDVFVAKLNASTGAWTWAVNYGGTGSDQAYAMCLDASTNIYIAGNFSNTWNGCTAPTTLGSTDLYIQKMSPVDGSCIWVASGGTTGGDVGTGAGICYVPATNRIVVSTVYNATTATYGGFSLPNSGSNDIAVLEINASTGAFTNALGFGVASNDDASAVTYDPSTGDVFVAGFYDIGNLVVPNGGAGITLTNLGATDIWIGRYSVTSHTFVWAKNAGGTGGNLNDERGYAICNDGSGTIAISGSYLSSPSAFGSLSLTNSSGQGQIFVAGYKATDGTALWVNNASTSGSPTLQSAARGIASVGSSGTYWVTGTFTNTNTFGAQPGITSTGFADLFNAKFTAPVLCATVTATISSKTDLLCNGSSTGSATVSGSGGSGFTYSWTTGSTSATVSSLAATTYTVTVSNSCSNSATTTVTITQPSALTASITQTSISCFGGSNGTATVIRGGGTGTLIQSWSSSGGTGTTASGLSANTYVVTVTDANNCTKTASTTITQPAVITATIAPPTNVSCFGGSNGSLTVTRAGGTGTLTQAWSPSGGIGTTANGLPAATYVVTVSDANGCTKTASAIITQPATAVSANISSSVNVGCFGGSTGSATASGSGGTGTMTYSWSTTATTASISSLAATTYTVTVRDANNCSTTSTVTITQPSTAVSGSANSTQTGCISNTGTASANPTGGTPGYNYLWSNSATGQTITGLAAGTYTVTISDMNGCIKTTTAIVSTTAGPTATATIGSNIVCKGVSTGSVNSSGSGGTTPYTYSWSNSASTQNISSVSAGTYVVTIKDANGCASVSTVTITEPATAVSAVVSSHTDVLCWGNSTGAATATGSGGTGTLTYTWNTGANTATITALSTATYTVTVKDANNCTQTTSVYIMQPSGAITGLMTLPNDVSCNGGNNGKVIMNAGGGTGTLTYSWAPAGGTSPIANNIPAGIYTCTVTDANNCSLVKTATITEPAVLTANITSAGNSATSNTTGGSPGYTYTWTSGSTTNSATGLANGTYTLTVTDAKGCTATGTVTIITSSIKTINDNAALTLYPNPTNGTFSVVSANQIGLICITDILGNVVLNIKAETKNQQVNLNNEPMGIYFVKVISGNDQQVIRLVKNQ